MRWLCLPRPSLSITNSMLCGAKPASSKRPSSLAWILRCATGRSMNIQALMLARTTKSRIGSPLSSSTTRPTRRTSSASWIS
jgi:hypothetical protein